MTGAVSHPVRPWQQVAAEAAQETDTNRLLELAQELQRAIDDRDKCPRPLDPDAA